MNYDEAIQFLYGLRLFGLKFGLENTRRLAELAGNPQDGLRFIHVAGTNGKGSTCAMLESIYRAAELRVGLFTSPHLVSFAERIQVNRVWIEQQDVARLVEELKNTGEFSGETSPTFFEAVTVMALKYFAEQKCNLVIWETGLGGRLDATNIVTPLASVITNVQFDHQQWLGNTLLEIAREKAGIIKDGIPVITGAEDSDALEAIIEEAKKHHAPLTIVTNANARALDKFEIGLIGDHQRMNAAVAVKTVEVLAGKIPVPESQLRRGLKDTQWLGRCQIVRRDNGQTVLIDGAHNSGGAQTLAHTWQKTFHEQNCALILGIMRDKDVEAICQILAPLAQRIILTSVNSERGADPNVLAEHCRRMNPSATITVAQNLTDALAKAGIEPFVVISGSLYLAGEALESLGLVPASQERELNEYGGAIVQSSSIRAVTFDVGGTLIHPWPSVGHVYAQVAKRHGIDVAPEILSQRFAAAWKSKKNFDHSKAAWAELVNQTFAGINGAVSVASFFPEVYDEFTNAKSWRIYDDARSCLVRLRKSGFKLGIISNWDERLRPLLKTLELDQYFDCIVISVEAGCAKPDARIFQTAAAQLGAPPRAILHVGDSRAEDFDGARAAGFLSLLLTHGSATTEEGTIASLEEVCARLADNKTH